MKKMVLFAAGITAVILGCVGCAGNQGNPSQAMAQTQPQTENVSAADAGVMDAENASIPETTENVQVSETEESMINIQVGDRVLTAVLADNSSAQALKEMLAQGPVTINMNDYANMEKVGPLGKSLPTNNEQITTEAGDLILYQGNSLVIYYDHNSWNFTRLGKISGVTAEELKSILGSGSVTVTLSLATAGNMETTAGTVGNSADIPTVFMTSDISPEGLMKAYEALGAEPDGKVAVKLSMGEPGGHNFLSPDLIKELVARVNGTIVDSNTAYGGRRASTDMHMQVAKDHGFADIAPIDILDAEGTVDLAVDNGTHLTRDIVGSHFDNYDSFLVLSHFKGHAMGGFGGAIKNISIGIASQNGKMLIHSGGHSDKSWSGGTQDDFLESMAEAAKAVSDSRQGKMLYVSVMNKLSVDCDCDSNPAEPDMHDIGILASLDPVALDQACVDLVYAAEDGASLIERIESRNGLQTLVHAAEIGLGSREYKLVSLDEQGEP